MACIGSKQAKFLIYWQHHAIRRIKTNVPKCPILRGPDGKGKKSTMPGKPKKLIAIIVVIAGMGCHGAFARDGLTITFPKRSKLTPVQRLNREGVALVQKQQYERAGALFYKAYLYDPTDPFTLNNLGYISELQGQLDRAQKFYSMASAQGTNANIDKSNAKQLEGRPMRFAFENLQDVPMRVNRMNVDAMSLLAHDRGFEAVALLQKTLSLDPQNAFTLNNLAVADEAIGDFDNALKYYHLAADSGSSEPVVVTVNESWRGKPVSRMAQASAKRLEARVRNMDPAEAQAIKFTMHGVTATNQNDWQAARKDFLQAYSLDPGSAFSLNNRGYVAERDGDLETAQFFYGKARQADDSSARIGLATERDAEGRDLLEVATLSNQKVDRAIDRYAQQRRQQQGPIELIPRGGTLVPDSTQPPQNQAPSNTRPDASNPGSQPHP